ncbi:MAG TPA: SH3 domain-containing protein [Chthoniobacterales bacterium]|nr:SH3 domain-containing protein [Chthoniobacterales bacterium]
MSFQTLSFLSDLFYSLGLLLGVIWICISDVYNWKEISLNQWLPFGPFSVSVFLKKYWLLIVLAFFLMLLGALIQPTIPLRDAPANNATILARLPFKEKSITVILRQGDWGNVCTNSGQYGWINRNALIFKECSFEAMQCQEGPKKRTLP